jgi:hypothetical protein
VLTIDEKEAQRKMEVIVERDDLAGDDDEIELSVHPYVNGKPQPLPVRPRIVLSMEQEKEVWKLNEVTVAMHVPLSDPDFLRDPHEHAMLIDDALASGKRGGYIFSIGGCQVAPASKFSVTAVPKEPDSELRAFCSDESAVLRYAANRSSSRNERGTT